MAFPGRFSQIILNQEQFLQECSEHTSPHMTCEAVMPGLWTESIVIFFEGTTANLVTGVKNIRTQGLDLPSFPNFAIPSLWPSKSQSTTTIEDALLQGVVRVSIETCHPDRHDLESSFLLLPVTFSKSTCASHVTKQCFLG